MSKLYEGPSESPPHKPSELMRAWHPEQFSDTTTTAAHRIPPPVLEFHIDSLTSRKQENEFESFCRRLAEKEICPNLRKAVGPSGGGDGKVDSETYPVAPKIAERWWIGQPTSGAERWAFAFSANKKWKPKAKADVNSIVSTNRSYARIHFFTNQSVSDRVRLDYEKELSELAGVPVHIYGRGWLVQKVVESGHASIAIETLGMQGFEVQDVQRGPNDVGREARLQELDAEIGDVERYVGARHQLVEDCLTSALLARNLERPASEVEGRFARAAKLAKEVNYRPQRLKIAYFRAWTAFWWYEDYAAFNELYDEVEGLAEGSADADDLERLTTLWQLLLPSVHVGRISGSAAKVGHRTKRLRKWLNKLATTPLRLNNALQARMSLAVINVTELGPRAPESKQALVWAEFSSIVDDSTGLGTFPLERLFGLLEKFGGFIESPSFDALYEKTVEIVRARRSDGTAGRLYADRASQKLEHERWYEAIQWYGRAEEVLVKDEYRDELVEVLIDASIAYEQVGLYWAARAKAVAAAHRAFAAFIKEGESRLTTLMAARRLVRLDLILGRLPHILTSMHLASMIEGAVKLSEKQRARLDEIKELDEGALGRQLLRMPIADLSRAGNLPDIFERHGMSLARLATLYALGHVAKIRDEGYFAAEEGDEEVYKAMRAWHDLPGHDDLKPIQGLAGSASILMTATVLGAEFSAEAGDNTVSFGIAESLLGALEAFLATSSEDDLLPHRARTAITIRADVEHRGMPEFRILREGGSRAEIVHAPDFSFMTAADGQAFVNWLRETVVTLFTQAFIIPNMEAWLEKIAGQERAFARAFSLGDLLTLNEHVFGDPPPFRLSEWMHKGDKEYEVLRLSHWLEGKLAEKSDRKSNPAKQVGSVTFDRSAFRHTDRTVVSPIEVALWDRARWLGVTFAVDPDPVFPPVLGIAFADMAAAEEIFRAWQQASPDNEADHLLRVSVLKGVATENPARYAVSIGPSEQLFAREPERLFVLGVRTNRMNAKTTAGLDTFVQAYRQRGGFLLAPATLGPSPEFSVDLAVGLRKLSVRNAYEVGLNDPDVMALSVDDDPVIPDGLSNPPVSEVLAQMREWQERRGNG